MGRAKSGDTLVQRMDAFAEHLLGLGEASESLADKIAVAACITRWVAVRARLDDDEDHEGAGIAELKRKLKGDNAGGTSSWTIGFGNHESRSKGGRIGMARRWGHADPSLTGGNGGELLDALKAKLPRPPSGGDAH